MTAFVLQGHKYDVRQIKHNTFICKGHSGKFGSYSVMDLRTSAIIDLQLLQVSYKYTITNI